MERCRTCKWWVPWKTTCERVDAYFQSMDDRFDILVQVNDDHGLSVSLLTGPDFGCIHHKSKEEAEHA